MYELIWAAENTYYIESPSRVGVYDLGDDHVCLIDSGNDKDAAKKILRVLEEKFWTLDFILITHSHADHIGGCRYLQEKTGCRVLAPGPERAFCDFPILEPSLLFGGRPPKALRNKYLMAESCRAEPLTQEALPRGLQLLPLDGHAMAMCGVYTDDGICFLADALCSEAVLQKYAIPYLYDVGGYLRALENLSQLKAALFLPAHAAPCQDLALLIEANKNRTLTIQTLLLSLCRAGACFEEILTKVFDYFGETLDLAQYALAGSTIRSYLSYLLDEGLLKIEFSENRLFWKTVPQA